MGRRLGPANMFISIFRVRGPPLRTTRRVARRTRPRRRRHDLLLARGEGLGPSSTNLTGRDALLDDVASPPAGPRSPSSSARTARRPAPGPTGWRPWLGLVTRRTPRPRSKLPAAAAATDAALSARMRSRSLRCSSQVLLTALRIAAVFRERASAPLEQLGRARVGERRRRPSRRLLLPHMKRSGLLILNGRRRRGPAFVGQRSRDGRCGDMAPAAAV